MLFSSIYLKSTKITIIQRKIAKSWDKNTQSVAEDIKKREEKYTSKVYHILLFHVKYIKITLLFSEDILLRLPVLLMNTSISSKYPGMQKRIFYRVLFALFSSIHQSCLVQELDFDVPQFSLKFLLPLVFSHQFLGLPHLRHAREYLILSNLRACLQMHQSVQEEDF